MNKTDLKTKFVQKKPLTFTTYDIVKELYDYCIIVGKQITKKQILEKLTPEICQKFVDNCANLHRECIDNDLLNEDIDECLFNKIKFLNNLPKLKEPLIAVSKHD